MTIRAPIRPAAITCSRCGGQAADPATDKHAAHKPGCTALADATTAMEAARDIEAALTWEMARAAASRGAMAVAQAAFIPGGPTVDELQQRYEELEAATRARAHAA
jgi:hypothetical protein